jgi:dihydrofolate reductase
MPSFESRTPGSAAAIAGRTRRWSRARPAVAWGHEFIGVVEDVSLGGGAEVATQSVAAGLLDELVISIVPLILGGGARLFAGLGDARPKLEQLQVVEAPGVTHIRYALAR